MLLHLMRSKQVAENSLHFIDRQGLAVPLVMDSDDSSTDEPGPILLDMDGSESTLPDDPHAQVHYSAGESSRMIGIPFHDEGGRWLYARVHFPLAAFSPVGA
ncbi:MAG: hypothetical protein ACYC3X_17525 [Pirellulaceae bacterium]